MSTRGPKPTPTVVHQMNGNPGKRDITERIELENSVPAITDVSLLEAPEWIKSNPIAKAEWDRVAPILADLGLLKVNDTSALEAYCKCWSRYKEAEQQIDKAQSTIIKTPSGYVQQIPQVSIAHRYLKLAKEFMTEFGLTPSSRGRMQLPRDDFDDEMEELLKGND